MRKILIVVALLIGVGTLYSMEWTTGPMIRIQGTKPQGMELTVRTIYFAQGDNCTYTNWATGGKNPKFRITLRQAVTQDEDFAFEYNAGFRIKGCGYTVESITLIDGSAQDVSRHHEFPLLAYSTPYTPSTAEDVARDVDANGAVDLRVCPAEKVDGYTSRQDRIILLNGRSFRLRQYGGSTHPVIPLHLDQDRAWRVDISEGKPGECGQGLDGRNK